MNSTQSQEIKDLISALSKAQGAMKPAIFNKVNPHFKNKYADLNSVMDACRSLLQENGLAIVQYCDTINDKLVLVTQLSHLSGQWMRSFFPLTPSTTKIQDLGACLTYAKRYSIAAMLCIVSDEDDDGESDRQRTEEKEKLSPEQVRHIENELKDMQDLKKSILDFMRVQSFSQMNAEDFDSLITKIRNAKKKRQESLEMAERAKQYVETKKKESAAPEEELPF